ncbi:class I SAM-dependent methyltransferase [Desulforamulus aeronauticus]|uniref:Methyltransferase domain-containing protein n=1 Tax=Desulforamulus aeronauticus DSM 10349 TaxID=1121421 RepID=A0A1M6T523_9FIRM|nr:class I SAM-dependent methyltransferase [Desulforamulus aeronauticus]SHK51979.1 hypothetical protein SAMN02745123_02175 [Desulforamulus aeronauticus DSM 10349]
MDNSRKQLIDLYMKSSKHSNYQILASNFQKLFNNESLIIDSRYEQERLDYILSKTKIKDKRILDIGGNSGYFTFEAINNGAKEVDYYDGNKWHAKFVELGTKIFGLGNKINVYNKYYVYGNKDKKYDVVFFLNVLHHLGDDYGDKSLSLEKAKQFMIQQLNNLAQITDILILQMGFNWCGNRKCCLFKKGTKGEMLNYIKENTSKKWILLDVGIAEEDNGKIQYNNVNMENIERNDKLGEFLNRPIIILKSRNE